MDLDIDRIAAIVLICEVRETHEIERPEPTSEEIDIYMELVREFRQMPHDNSGNCNPEQCFRCLGDSAMRRAKQIKAMIDRLGAENQNLDGCS